MIFILLSRLVENHSIIYAILFINFLKIILTVSNIWSWFGIYFIEFWIFDYIIVVWSIGNANIILIVTFYFISSLAYSLRLIPWLCYFLRLVSNLHWFWCPSSNSLWDISGLIIRRSNFGWICTIDSGLTCRIFWIRRWSLLTHVRFYLLDRLGWDIIRFGLLYWFIRWDIYRRANYVVLHIIAFILNLMSSIRLNFYSIISTHVILISSVLSIWNIWLGALDYSDIRFISPYILIFNLNCLRPLICNLISQFVSLTN